MSELKMTKRWFELAVPKPTPDNLRVQLGCHFEEVVEMLAELAGVDAKSEMLRLEASLALHALAEALKANEAELKVTSRVDLLDALADQIVTGTGVGHMLDMDIPEGMARVNKSNFSKFDDNGKPIFKDNGKIAKSSNFQEPDFEGCY